MPNYPMDNTKTWREENWHALEGPLGQCACGSEKGVCGVRLESFIEKVEAAAFRRGLSRAVDYTLNTVEEKLNHTLADILEEARSLPDEGADKKV